MTPELLCEPPLHPDHGYVPPTWKARVPHLLDILMEYAAIDEQRRWKVVARRELFRMAAILDELGADMGDLWRFVSWNDYLAFCIEGLDGLIHVSLSPSDITEFFDIRKSVQDLGEVADELLAIRK